MTTDGAQELIERYGKLIALYHELETVSKAINDSLENGAQVHSLTDHLKRNMVVAEQIREESHAINAIKHDLSSSIGFNDIERERIRSAEDKITALVNSVVAQGNRSRDLMTRQGVKISRR